MSGLNERLAALTPEQRRLLARRRAARRTGREADRAGPFSLLAEEDRQRLPAGLEDAYPVSHLQLGMLYHLDLEAGERTRAYHNVNRWHLRAPFDAVLLRRAIREEVPRHEFLRTGFDLASYSEPLQLLHARVEVPVLVEDLRALPPERRRERVEAAVRLESRRPFDLERPPLWRFRVLRDGEDTFHFLLTELHAIADGWSLNATLADVLRRYFALLDGEEPPEEPSPAFRYRDFVELEREARRSPECRRFWEGKVADLPVVRLPRRAPDAPPYPPRKLHLPIPAELVRRLERDVAGPAGAPLKSALLAAHLEVLSLFVAGDEVVTGLVSNGRPERGDGDRVRGLFLNTLPLRLPVSRRDGSWIERVRRVFEAEVETLPHRRYPLADLRRSAGDPDPFETTFAYVRFHSLAGVARRLAFDSGGFSAVSVTNYPLAAVFQSAPEGDASKLTLVFDDGRLSRSQVATLLGRYRRVLEAMAAAPDAPPAPTDLFLPGEQHRLLHEWNDTPAPLPGPPRIHELVAEQAAANPDAVALEMGDRSLSYGQLVLRWRRAAGRLGAAGVRPGDRVGLVAERSIETVVALLAILEAGAAFVPLDPDHPRERLRFQVGDGDLWGIVGAAAAVDRVPLEDGAGDRRRLSLEALCAVPSEEGDHAVLPAWAEGGGAWGELPAYVLYTSGTTGRPKAVVMPHRGIRNRLLWMLHRLPLRRGDRVLQKTPLTFDASLWELFLPLLNGGRVVLARPDGHRDTAYLARTVADRDVEVLQMVPSQLGVFLAEPDLDRVRALRLLFCGGEALPADLQRRALDRLPVRLHNLYGPTEAAIDVASRRCDPRGADPRVLLGRPLPNTRLRVLGPGLELRPVAAVGEICAGGVHLAHGYAGRPGRTAGRFVPDPFASEPGARLYRTGDLGRVLADGTLQFLGRADAQLKVRGVRVEPGEVEAALVRHPRVRAAAVVGRRDGGGELQLVGYVVAPPPRPSEAELKSHLRGLLPAALVPARVVFLERLPRTSGGKLDRRALPAPPSKETAGVAPVPPSGAVEELLADLWAALLERDRVGADQDVFELGAHSLTATRLVSQVRRTFGIEMPLRDVFAAPTVAGLARKVRERLAERGGDASGGAPPPPLVPAGDGAEDDPPPLSFAQERLWFLDQLEPGSAVYNVPFGLRLTGPLEVAALEQALGQVVRRHRVLRSRFPERRGVPRQEVMPPPAPRLPVVDLVRLAGRDRERVAEELAAEAAARPFDLARGPLVRSVLLRSGDERHAAVVVLHHIVSDAWSTGVLTAETSAAYRDLAAGRFPGLPELPVQYSDYALWQRRWLQGPALEGELAFWRRALAGAPRLALPGGGDDGRDPRGAHLRFRVEPEQTEALRRLGRRERVTPFMTLLAALQVLLAREAGQTDVVVGTDVANRTRGATEGLVGFFINLLALRTDLGGDPPFREVLRRVRRVTLEAYAHQELPFARVVEELRPERRTRTAPLFDVLFVYQNTPREPLRLPDLEVESLPLAAPHSRFDLGVFVEEEGGGLRGRWTYRTARFSADWIGGLAERYQALLAEVAEHPDRRFTELELGARRSAGDPAERRDRQRSSFSRFVGSSPVAAGAEGEG